MTNVERCGDCQGPDCTSIPFVKVCPQVSSRCSTDTQDVACALGDCEGKYIIVEWFNADNASVFMY